MVEAKPMSIEQQIESLPPLSDTVARVMEVINDPESSANDLVKAVLPDQAMCVAILKIANSVLYGRPKKVSSVETAIMVLGFNEVQNIVLGKAALTAFKPIMKKYEAELKVFWDHSFTCGLAARIIAEHINQSPGQFFIAGLLHDIGKLAMLLAFGENYQPAKWLVGYSSTARLEEEKETFKVTHDQIGSRLLQRWQFPNALINALYYHHVPRKAEKSMGFPMIIQMADFLAHMNGEQERPDEQTLKTVLDDYLPDFVEQWQGLKLPWEDITLETWFAWVKVDREHGGAILDILTT